MAISLFLDNNAFAMRSHSDRIRTTTTAGPPARHHLPQAFAAVPRTSATGSLRARTSPVQRRRDPGTARAGLRALAMRGIFAGGVSVPHPKFARTLYPCGFPEGQGVGRYATTAPSLRQSFATTTPRHSHYSASITPPPSHNTGRTAPQRRHYQATATPLPRHCTGRSRPLPHHHQTTTLAGLHHNQASSTPLQCHSAGITSTPAGAIANCYQANRHRLDGSPVARERNLEPITKRANTECQGNTQPPRRGIRGGVGWIRPPGPAADYPLAIQDQYCPNGKYMILLDIFHARGVFSTQKCKRPHRAGAHGVRRG